MKLYLAKQTHYSTAMFLSDNVEEDLKLEAKGYLDQEAVFKNKDIEIKEITSFKDIPEEWKDANLWGIKEEVHVREYFQYLKLKAIFENTDVNLGYLNLKKFLLEVLK